MAVNSFNAQNPPVNTKGDLFTFSTIPTKLGVGSNNQVLTADSTTATGLKWAVDPTTDVVTTAGDLIYGTAADTVTRLGIGTAGQVLKVNSGATAPEWGAAGAAATSFALINSGGTALTGATTITISGFSGYNTLYFVIDKASSVNASSTFRIRLNADSGANYNDFGGVVTGRTTYAAGTVVGQGTSTGATFFEDIGQMSTNAASRVAGGGFIQGCNSSGVKMLISMTGAGDDGGVDHKVLNNVGYYTGSSAITSFSLISSTGNFDNGTLYLWGA